MSNPKNTEIGKRDVNWAQVANLMKERLDQSAEQQAQAIKTARYAIGAVVGMAVMSLGGIALVLTKYPLERYLYTDNAKAICEAQLEIGPLVTTNTVTEFAKDCVLDMDTFAHDTFEKDLSRMAARCFTPGFRKKYMEMDWLADRVSTVRSGLLRVSSQTTGPVLVASSGPTAEGYTWRVQVPVKRIFRQGDSPKGSNERVYEVDVYRVVRDAFNPVGLGVNAVYERTGVLK